MKKTEKAAALKEWVKVLKAHPKFARAMLAQQVILMEASELGNRLVDVRMCQLLDLGLVVPFMNFWLKRCSNLVPLDPPPVIACLSSNRDPADCLSLAHQDEWFNDPLAGGRTLPPKPPIPPYGGTAKKRATRRPS